jgi:hypothetical protein
MTLKPEPSLIRFKLPRTAGPVFGSRSSSVGVAAGPEIQYVMSYARAMNMHASTEYLSV